MQRIDGIAEVIPLIPPAPIANADAIPIVVEQEHAAQ